ncbi:MAG: hypothetical protein ACKOKF_06660 [Bacteroidota bacterium]
MKTTFTKSSWKIACIVLMAVLFQGRSASGAAFVNMYTEQCAAGSNWIEFRQMITNTSTAGETLYIQAPGTWRMNHSAAIVPAGTNTFTLQYIANSADPMLAPLYATVGTSYNISYANRRMQVTYSTSILGNSISSPNAPLLPGQTIAGGKFRLTITNTNFVAGQSTGFTWVTTSGIVAYINTNATPQAMNTNTYRSLGTLCQSTIPAPCSVTATGSSTSPSCFGAGDGSASVSASGSSPFTYLWSNGGTGSSISGLSAGSYSVTVTATGGCTASATVAVSNPAQPQAPSIACYETATWNSSTCRYDVTGTQPQQPEIACYQTATFNGTTCQWDVTGTQPQQPSIACYETATFNGTTCQWDVTGTQPQQPTIACYQTATFNGTTCQWDVTGTQPQQP